MTIYTTSDHHFGHRMIGKYCDRPFADIKDDAKRIAEIDCMMIERWRERVTPDDIVIHCGDLSFYKPDATAGLMAFMPGRKYLIRGNHDKWGKARYLAMGFKDVLGALVFPAAKVKFTHVPDYCSLAEGWINIHGHLHNTPYYGPSDGLINVCVEMTDYYPVDIQQLLDPWRVQMIEACLSQMVMKEEEAA